MYRVTFWTIGWPHMAEIVNKYHRSHLFRLVVESTGVLQLAEFTAFYYNQAVQRSS